MRMRDGNKSKVITAYDRVKSSHTVDLIYYRIVGEEEAIACPVAPNPFPFGVIIPSC